MHTHPAPYNDRERASSSLLPPRDPLLHDQRVTQPGPILAGEQQTPEAACTYTHRPDLAAYVLPRLEMRFETYVSVKTFYNVYARFVVRCGPKIDNRMYIYCMCQGKYEPSVSEADRQRNKTTSKTDYKARIWIKQEKDVTYVIKGIKWEHNHRLIVSLDMLVFLHSHNNFDPTILEYVKFLQFKGVKHSTIMSILGGDDPDNYSSK